jgi:hypothetical protein
MPAKKTTKKTAKKTTKKVAKKVAKKVIKKPVKKPVKKVAKKVAKKAAKKAAKKEEVEEEFPELEEDEIDSDDEGIELSDLPIKSVDGVEYHVMEQDGQTVLLSRQGEPVGVYDAETDTIQEADFE